MKPTIRFIHSADLHLDSPYKGMQDLPASIFNDVKESTLIAYERLIDLAIKEQVDFVLFVGDLFDQQSTSIKSVMKLKQGLERLNDHGIVAYVSFGNHDFGIGEKVDLTFPENTYVFESEEITSYPFTKNGQEVARIYGFSYERRAVKKKKVREYDMNRPDVYQIATLHGSIQSNTDHDVYAPFTLDEIKKHPADYWALGHIHKREILTEEPYVVYPGNIQARHINEPGEKGCYLVELSDHDTTLDFHPLQEIVFEEKSVKELDSTSLDGITEELIALKDTWRNAGQKKMIRLHLHLPESLALTKEKQDELYEILNEDEEMEPDWVWIQSMTIHLEVTYDREKLKESNQFIGEVLKTVDSEESAMNYLEMLANKREIKKHVQPFSEDALDDIKKEAEQMIIKELIKDGEA